METSSRRCANELLEVVPLMMRVIRAKVRSCNSPELSMPQFRALAFLGRNKRAMLGDVANFLGLTLPASSKLIDGLVSAGLTRREINPVDRRKIVLTLTRAGDRKYASALQFTGDFLADRVSRLSLAERGRLAQTMKRLRTVFADDPPETGNGAARPKRLRRED